jgi:putative glutamine amidotransferase
VILPPVPADEVQALIEHLDGLVLSGGPDLDPQSYGRRPHPQLGPIESEIDTFELALCAAALAEGTPMLGICRGMQLLNVAGGGTLHQHIPDLGIRDVLHRAGAGELASHRVRVDPQSRLAELVGAEPLEVNSFHHQAVDRLAPGLRAVAWAPDGIIEAVEAADGEPVFGVQWHVESLTHDPRHLALLARFVDRARTQRPLRTDTTAGEVARPAA